MQKQIVTIDFKKDQGLILKWNYIDLTRRNNYYRHIIVLLSSTVETISSALENYIKHIKCGDLYTVVYSDSDGVIKIKNWREKTNLIDISLHTYFNEQRINSLPFEQAVSAIQKQIQQMNEPIILNFITQNPASVQGLKTKLKDRNFLHRNRFISTIFSNKCPNSISICDGVNTFSLKSPKILEFYHQYLNQMAIQYAHITISSRNGEIGSCNQYAWKNTAFNKIERTFYGPSIKYQYDALHFINAKRMIHGSYDLDICLEYKCFGGKRYTSEKSINIIFNRSQAYNRTIVSQKYKIYYLKEGIELQQSPFSSETLVYFEQLVGQCKNEFQL